MDLQGDVKLPVRGEAEDDSTDGRLISYGEGEGLCSGFERDLSIDALVEWS
jgi:hypothetical protein